MPRTRKRTTSKASWTSATLQSAIKTIRDEGISVNKAAQQYQIPYSTLKKRYRLANSGDDAYSRSPSLGRKAVFTSEQEQILVSHILDMSNIFYGLTSIQLRKICYNMAVNLGVTNRFNSEKKIAGKDWLYGFMNRHQKLSIRKPEATSVNRILGFNKTEVTRFFSNLESVMTKFSFEPQNIFNMDETGFSTVHVPDNIIALKGRKRVGAATSWERGKNVTAICAMSATGIYVPPLFIFPRQRHSPQLERDGPSGAIYTCSKNGWTNEQIFITWLEHFIKFTSPNAEKQTLLIMDNHNSHATLEAYEMAKKNYITMLSIPPHSSHRLQPLDVTFFGPLKTAYKRECDMYMKSRNMIKITPYEIAGLFNKAYSKIASLDKGISGFKTTGIFPMDPSVFSDEDFFPLGEYESDINPTNVVNTVSPSKTIATVSSAQEALQTSSSQQPSTDQSQHEVQRRDSPQPSTSFADILNVLSPRPNVAAKSKKVNRHKQHSEVLTSTPMKEVFEEKKDKKNKREMKGNKSKKILIGKSKDKRQEKNKLPEKKLNKVTKYLFQDSTSQESSIDENIHDDDSEYSHEENVCMICNDIGKDEELWYRCRACGKWAHSECSGYDHPKDYLCNFCLDP